MKRIESKQNSQVKAWKKLHTKKGRDRTGCFLIEGPHLIEEALKSDVELVDLILRENFIVPETWNIEDDSVVSVTDNVMNEISETEHPQGVAAVCRKRIASIQLLQGEGRYLLIDGVQDPGNIGTMIRTADGAGMSAVILGKGCADPYNGKGVRSTQGSLFHLPVIQAELDVWIRELNEKQIPVFATALRGGKTYTAVVPPKSFALLVGNEGRGVKPDLLKQANERLYIPIYGQAESLNVSIAAGILLYYFRGM